MTDPYFGRRHDQRNLPSLDFPDVNQTYPWPPTPPRRPLPQSVATITEYAGLPSPAVSPAGFNHQQLRSVSMSTETRDDRPFVPPMTKTNVPEHYPPLQFSGQNERSPQGQYDRTAESDNCQLMDYSLSSAQSRRGVPYQLPDATQNQQYHVPNQPSVAGDIRTMDNRFLASNDARNSSLGPHRSFPHSRRFEQDPYGTFDHHGRRVGSAHARLSPTRAAPDYHRDITNGRPGTLAGGDQSPAMPDGDSSFGSSTSDDDATLQIATHQLQPRQQGSSPAPKIIGSYGRYSGNLLSLCASMDPGDFLRDRLNLPQDATVNLQSVRDSLDPDGKPNQPLQLLVQVAIYGSPRKKLTLQEIYGALKERFPYFRNRPDVAWQHSIRHALSLYAVFRHQPRPLTEQGKGKYWELDYSKGFGTKRTRKRRTHKASDAARFSATFDAEGEDDDMDDDGTCQTSLAPQRVPHPDDSHFGAGRLDQGGDAPQHGVHSSSYQPHQRSHSAPGSTRANACADPGLAYARHVQYRISARSVSPHSQSDGSTGQNLHDHDGMQRLSPFEDRPGFRPVAFGQSSLTVDSTRLVAALSTSATNVPRTFHPADPSYSDAYPSSPAMQRSDGRGGLAVPNAQARSSGYGYANSSASMQTAYTLDEPGYIPRPSFGLSPGAGGSHGARYSRSPSERNSGVN